MILIINGTHTGEPIDYLPTLMGGRIPLYSRDADEVWEAFRLATRPEPSITQPEDSWSQSSTNNWNTWNNEGSGSTTVTINSDNDSKFKVTQEVYDRWKEAKEDLRKIAEAKIAKGK